MNTSAVSPIVDPDLENKQAEAKRIIEAMGGQAEVARFFEVSRAAVNQWLTAGIPDARMQTIKHARPELVSSAA